MEVNYIEAVQNLEYEPEFVFNDQSGRKVLTEIEKGLLNCDHFDISVAFITCGGIVSLLPTFKQLETKGIKGRILTTDYLCFSQPKALRDLHQFKNLEIKMYRTAEENVGFHTKGYIFEKKENYHIIIGSSNMTQDALTKNKEWNVKINVGKESEITNSITDEFEKMWNSDNSLDFSEFIDKYEEEYDFKQDLRKLAEKNSADTNVELKPNSMQEAFIHNLEDIISDGKDRALLISATGTGKTYASAFAMRHFKFKRVLFLVHRNQLAKQAEKSYKNVFGNKFSSVTVGEGKKDINADYIFGVINTICKDEFLHQFKQDEFDCIIIDEAHHSSANMYQKIMNYFKPKLWLGMTATPDRVEAKNQENIIYKLFGYNIAYEIRLQQAMDDDLLCPFHYFGINDIKINDEDYTSDNEINFNRLTSDERVNRIIEKSNFYGYSGERVKGLIFCNRIKVANVLSEKFNDRGFNTVVLDGSSSDSEREDAFERLAMNKNLETADKKALDFIFSVNLLNEGVDIVEVNQVIMCRPTESPIVFVQQLGRGLRKAANKEYVVVLDFIGNYKKNFLIPIALSGDRTYNKDNIRRFIAEGNNVIHGASTIHFDEISKQQIYKVLDSASFNETDFIKSKYNELKSKIGRIPTMSDFEDYGELDIMHIVEKFGSYYEYLNKYEKEYHISLDEDAREMLMYFSRRFMNGKRPDDLEMLETIINNIDSVDIIAKYKENMNQKYSKKINEIQENNIIHIMTNEFESGQDKKRYQHCIFLQKEQDNYKCAVRFKELLSNIDFKNIVEEIIKFGLNRYEKEYKYPYKDSDFVLNKKYSYYDVSRLLNWSENPVAQNVGGYFYDSTTKTFPVFINYQKDENINESIKYEDRFLNRNHLISLTKPGRNMESNDAQNFINARERGIKIQLFVRKNKKDKGAGAKQFYFLGEMSVDGDLEKSTVRKGLEIPWKLDTPVREDVYDYIVNE